MNVNGKLRIHERHSIFRFWSFLGSIASDKKHRFAWGVFDRVFLRIAWVFLRISCKQKHSLLRREDRDLEMPPTGALDASAFVSILGGILVTFVI